MDIFLHKVNFHFLLLLKNEDIKLFDMHIIKPLINNITKYLISDKYIKIDGKPILSINNPYILNNRTNIINLLRKEANKSIGNIYIIYPFRGNYNNKKFFRDFDGIYDFSNE